MTQPKLVVCNEHGPSHYCYVQEDGSHVDQTACTCRGNGSPDCPVDLHRTKGSLPKMKEGLSSGEKT